jgi:sugar phosphate isomerase/epimerase
MTIISALHFPWDTIEECFQRASGELGLDGVEVSLNDSFAHPHCTRENLKDIPSLREKYGIQVSAHIWENIAALGVDVACEKLLYWKGVSEKAGVKGLVIHGGSYPDRKEGIKRTVQVLGKVIPKFERSNIKLHIENHYAYDYRNCQELFSEVWEFMELFRQIQSPSLEFCFDTGHANMTGNGEQLLHELSAYLTYVHLADNHGENDDHCMYGEGNVPWKKYFDILSKQSFDGTFCVEFPVRDNRLPFYACMKELDTRGWK